MKKLLILFLLMSFSSFAQDVNVSTNILVEDNSVEAVREKYRLESMSARSKRIREYRNARLSKWKNKELIDEDLSKIKYVFLFPPERFGGKITKRLKKNWKKSLPEYVYFGGKNSTHKSIPKDLKTNPEKVLYMYVDVSVSGSLVEGYIQTYDTYIQLYDYTGKLVYANGNYDGFYSQAVNKLIADFEFAIEWGS